MNMTLFTKVFFIVLVLIEPLVGCAEQYVYTVPPDPNVLILALKAEGIEKPPTRIEIEVMKSDDNDNVRSMCGGYTFAFPIVQMLKQTAEKISAPSDGGPRPTIMIHVGYRNLSCSAQGDLGKEWPLVQIAIEVEYIADGRSICDEFISSDYKAGGIYNNFNLYGYPDKSQAPEQYALATYRAMVDALEKSVNASKVLDHEQSNMQAKVDCI